MIDFTKKVTTRDGREVKIFTTEARHNLYSVVGEYLDNDGKWEHEQWTKEGKFSKTSEDTSKLDLINPPEEKWINVYPGDGYSSKKEADMRAKPNRIACIKFTEGEGL